MNFQEYTQATQMLNRLKGQASDLELLLDQLNSLEANLDDSLLAPPAREDPGDLAARKAKRAAKRAERRAKATTAAVSGGAEDDAGRSTLSSQRTASGPASSSGRSALDSFKSMAAPAGATGAPATSTAAASDVQQLEELFRLTVGEPELPLSGPQPAAPLAAAPGVLRPRKATAKRVPAPVRAQAPAAPATLPAPAVEPAAAAPLAPAPELPRLPAVELPAPKPPTPSRRAAAAPADAPAKPASQPAAAPAPQAVTPPPAAVPAPAAASAAVPAAAPDSLMQTLERLLGGHSGAHGNEEAEFDSIAGPSDDDLLALEREAASLAAALEGAEEEEAAAAAEARAASARELETSALAARAPAQVSVMPTGPSLLSLVPASATQGRSARSRQARRSARYGHSSATARSGGAAADGPRGGKVQNRDGTNHFLYQSSSVAVLAAETEREVTEVCRDYLFLEKVKRQCEKTLHRPPTMAEVAAAVGMDVTDFNLRHEAGLRAKELLLKSNYRLVMTVCKKFVNKGSPLQDLVSDGVKGLLRACEMYDASKGFRFGTYAHWWIRQAISRSMAETGRAIRLPTHTIEQLTRLKNASTKLSNELNRAPTLPELAAAIGLTVPRVEMLLESARGASSMDTPMAGNDHGATLKDAVQDDSQAADEAFGSSSMRADVEAVLEGLPEREAAVLRLRFGLEDGVEWTLEDIGVRLGVTRERIRQMEAKALLKLQETAADWRGKLGDYASNLDMLDGRELASRVSNGTRKT